MREVTGVHDSAHDSGAPFLTDEVPEDPLLSVRQVAERLNVSTATVHRLLEVRDLGHVRIGVRTIRVPESALQNYLDRCTVRCLR